MFESLKVALIVGIRMEIFSVATKLSWREGYDGRPSMVMLVGPALALHHFQI